MMAGRGHSIVGRLCRHLIWQTLIGMGIVCGGIYAATSMFIKAEQKEQLAGKSILMRELMYAAFKKGGAEEIVSKLRQVDVLVAQGTPVADGIRSIGVTEVTLGSSPRAGCITAGVRSTAA